MEIRINQHESYKIDIPSVVDKVTFFGLLDKLNSVSKILSKADLFANPQVSEDGEEIIEEKKQYNKRRGSKPYSITREQSIKTLKMHYFKSKEEKNKQAKEWGYETWSELVKNFHSIKVKYGILPKEIGLKKFPNRIEGRHMAVFLKFNKL